MTTSRALAKITHYSSKILYVQNFWLSVAELDVEKQICGG